MFNIEKYKHSLCTNGICSLVEEAQITQIIIRKYDKCYYRTRETSVSGEPGYQPSLNKFSQS